MKERKKHIVSTQIRLMVIIIVRFVNVLVKTKKKLLQIRWSKARLDDEKKIKKSPQFLFSFVLNTSIKPKRTSHISKKRKKKTKYKENRIVNHREI